MEIAIGFCNDCKCNVYRSAQGDRCGCDRLTFFTCKDCGKKFRDTEGRGRPKKRCKACIIKKRNREAREYKRKRRGYYDKHRQENIYQYTCQKIGLIN